MIADPLWHFEVHENMPPLRQPVTPQAWANVVNPEEISQGCETSFSITSKSRTHPYHRNFGNQFNAVSESVCGNDKSNAQDPSKLE
jgi:hypothetical protein